MRPIFRALLPAGLTLLPLLVTLACASRVMGRRREPTARDWSLRLGLSKEQEDKLAYALWDERTSMDPLRAKERDALQLLGAQLEKKAPDDDIRATLAELELTRTAAEVTEENFWTAVASTLNPTQRARLLLEMSGRASAANGSRR